MTKTIYATMTQILAPIKNDISSSSNKAKLANLRTSMRWDAQQGRQMGSVWQLLFQAMPSPFLSRNGELTYEERAVLNALQLYAMHQRSNLTPVDVRSKRKDDSFGDFDVQARAGRFIVKSRTTARDSFQVQSLSNVKEAIQRLKAWDKETTAIRAERNDDGKNAPKYVKDLGRSLKELRNRYDDRTAIDRRFNTMVSADTYDEIISGLRSLIQLLRAKSPDTKVDYAQLAQDLFWILSSPTGADKVRMAWSQSYYSFYDSNKGED